MMRCANFGNGKRSHSKRGVDNVAMTTSDKVNKKNDKKIDSPRSCQEQSTSGHSTPITKKRNTNADKEGSPDFDYSPSPILPTFTQEGGNEVAWDWQSSMSRTPENSKKQNVHCETPKGTKLLQRKRISNSPLLYKPLKRKTIKMENIENIGQFAAELQALNERMRVIKQNDNNHSNDCVEKKEVPTLTNISDKEEISKVQDKQNSVEKCNNDNEQRNDNIEETNNHSNTSKKETSGTYDDLFDDSVDDDIIRCTQEIEKKFNLLERGNTQLQVKKEDSCKNDVSNKTSVQSSSSENSKNPLRSVRLWDNSSLKTYSKLKRDANSSIHSAVQNSKDTYKPCPNNNNNNTIRSFARKSCDNKKLLKSNTVDLYDFHNDSFDDWLASCVEEEKLLPKSDVSSTHKNDSTKVQANYKHLTNAPLKSEVKSTDSFKPMTKPETSNANYLQNRKFFKTKSLSEQPVNRDVSAKGSRASVSTKPIVTNDCKAENKAISLIHSMNRMRGSDVNRCAVKSDGNHFVKHHSTGNIKNDIRETAKKSGSQPTTRCSAEEIEKKRLQAVARLEARRKLHFTKITNNINR